MTTMTKTTHRHVKSGKLISVVGRGHFEEDLTPVVGYFEQPDGRFWVRRAEIFDDGRFVPVTSFAWVIEHGGSKPDKPLYMCGLDALGRFKWSFEHNTATRFTRENDAISIARGDHLAENHRVCEHGWDEGRTGAAPGAGDGNDPATEK